MKEFIHIIHSDFTRNVRHKPPEWWPYRLKILENFTLASLKNQTEKDFYYVMYLRRGTSSTGMIFPDECLPLLKNILDRSGLRYSIIYEDAEEEIGVKIMKDFPEAKYVYATRIDSDDMFHRDAVKEIQSHEFGWRRALVYQKGYYYDCVNKQMRDIWSVCPPFFTVIFPYAAYLTTETIEKYKDAPEGHDQIIHKMNSITLSENKFMVLIHGKNNRSTFSDPGENVSFVPIEQHKEILENFGITENTYFEKIQCQNNI
jgi:hypothetical protein